MKALAALLGLLALALLLPAPAAAQQSSTLVVALEAPSEALTEDVRTLVLHATATLTADWTAATSLSGIPVTYTVSAAPEWAAVVVSPANDVFPPPSVPSPSTAYTVTRAFTITISLADEPEESTIAPIEITATTSPGFLGAPAYARGMAPVSVYVPEDEECPEHALTQEQLALYAEQASAALDEYEASRGASSDDGEVTTQSTAGASMLSTPWVAIAGFALVGAAVGLALRRKLVR